MNRFYTVQNTISKHLFLFEELVKRDFKDKYKRTILGMGWSILSPLLTLFIMNVIFSRFFGSSVEHYSIYLFCGNLVYAYFRESTTGGMNSLRANAHIFTKVNIPKYLFLFSKNISSLINFGLTLIIFFLFVYLDGISIGLKFVMLLYPIICLVVFNIGVGLILSALYVFFRDITYLYEVFTMLVMYASAIFYTVDTLSYKLQTIFLLNPVYVYIKYFRTIVLENSIPGIGFHLLCAFYAIVFLSLGLWIYKRYNHEFLYYV